MLFPGAIIFELQNLDVSAKSANCCFGRTFHQTSKLIFLSCFDCEAYSQAISAENVVQPKSQVAESVTSAASFCHLFSE